MNAQKLLNLILSYPDFKLNDVIDPDQFDTNNAEVLNSVNKIIGELNNLVDDTIAIDAKVDSEISSLQASTSDSITSTSNTINTRIDSVESAYIASDEQLNTKVDNNYTDLNTKISNNQNTLNQAMSVINNDIGSKASLNTSNKDTLVKAINEVFEKISVLKTSYEYQVNPANEQINCGDFGDKTITKIIDCGNFEDTNITEVIDCGDFRLY